MKAGLMQAAISSSAAYTKDESGPPFAVYVYGVCDRARKGDKKAAGMHEITEKQKNEKKGN
jgi:hypothetical protein